MHDHSCQTGDRLKRVSCGHNRGCGHSHGHGHGHKHNCGHDHSTKHHHRDADFDVPLTQQPVQHEDHQHFNWESDETIARLQKCIKYYIAENDEGCPCCVAGLDFDEFAAAIKEIARADGSDEALAGVADFADLAHWGLFLGVAAPLGLVGLAAAVRNLKGAGAAYVKISDIIKVLDDAINTYRQKGNTADAEKLEAFRRCLVYSKRDAAFNVAVPGAINGAASIAVLSTAFTKHPFALPIIGVYAFAQLVRNVWDGCRTFLARQKHRLYHQTQDMRDKNDKANFDPQKLGHIEAGKKKSEQITQSKLRFFLANSLGFATFAAGALATFVAVPALGLFGAGALIMPFGLTALAGGAVSTGIMNNIWPRKFKPRNGDLGIFQGNITSPEHALNEIGWRRERKKQLQSLFPYFKTEGHRTKKWLKFLTALPEAKDFMPAKMAKSFRQYRKRFTPLPDTGTGASDNKHQLNLDIAQRLHQDDAKSQMLQHGRLALLATMAGKDKDFASRVAGKDKLKTTWSLLKELELDHQVVPVWLNEKFYKRTAAEKGTVGQHDNSCDGCGSADHHAHEEKDNHSHNHSHEHGHEHKHEHEHEHGHSCGHDHHADANIPGFREINDHHHESTKGTDKTPEKRAVFNIDDFIAKSNEDDQKRLQSAIDYFLFFQYPKKLTYQIYGLNDYYQQMLARPQHKNRKVNAADENELPVSTGVYA